MVLTLPTEAQGGCGQVANQSLRVGLGLGGHINTRSTGPFPGHRRGARQHQGIEPLRCQDRQRHLTQTGPASQEGRAQQRAGNSNHLIFFLVQGTYLGPRPPVL